MELIVHQSLRRAIAAHTGGRLQEATHLYQTILRAEPDHPDANHNLGLIAITSNEIGIALPLFKAALKKAPKIEQFWLSYIDALIVDKQFEIATKVSEEAKAHNPFSDTLHYNLAVIFGERGATEKALAQYIRSFTLNPERSEAYNNAGMVLQRDNRLNAARALFDYAIKSNPRLAQAYNNLGNLFMINKAGGPIETKFKQAILLQPNFNDGYRNLANFRFVQSGSDCTTALYKKALILNPDDDIALHMLNSLTGITPKTASPNYVKKLFDDYSTSFDEDLVKRLQYAVPKKLRNLHDCLFQPATIYNKCLDLGCGTGLSGNVFRNISQELTGIDISTGMIRQAKRKGIYDSLFVGDIKNNLKKLSGNSEIFDLIICADVLIYLGECEELFSLISKISIGGTKFLLSTEKQAQYGYTLLKSGRFKHSSQYLTKCASENGFVLRGLKETLVRNSPSGPILGDLIAFERL